MPLRSINQAEIAPGTRVLMRSSLNVPISDSGKVADDFRLFKILPTLQLLLEHKAKVTLISHIGSDGSASLAPVETRLRELLPGDYSVHENLRIDPREKLGDESFAKGLAQGFDIFVNEDFPASHRPHASIIGLPKFLPSYIGFQFKSEIEHLSKFVNPPSGAILILGGAKLTTKLPLIQAFLPKVDKIFLGSFYLKERANLPNDEKIILPGDSTHIEGDVVDIGPETLAQMCSAVARASSIIWNGPLGKFEAGYNKTTEDLAKAIANSGAKSVVGGGDSIASIRKLNLLDKFTFVSTGGGAMLDFLTQGTLPGIEAIKSSKL